MMGVDLTHLQGQGKLDLRGGTIYRLLENNGEIRLEGQSLPTRSGGACLRHWIPSCILR